MKQYPYLQEYRDKDGRLRRYVRKRGQPLIPIHGRKGSGEFLEQYRAAVGGREVDGPIQPPSVEGHIYFADDGQFIKIGFAVDVEQRLSELQIGASRPIQLLGSRCGTLLDERRLHRKFASLRHRGEWFRPGLELLEYIGVKNSWADA